MDESGETSSRDSLSNLVGKRLDEILVDKDVTGAKPVNSLWRSWLEKKRQSMKPQPGTSLTEMVGLQGWVLWIKDLGWDAHVRNMWYYFDMGLTQSRDTVLRYQCECN